MKSIIFPDLKRIEIIDYSLYSQCPTFSYDFVKGINLIIGGNGLGKTTFLNLIKYALVGRYKNITDIRTYKEKKIERRYCDDYNYFQNRMNKEYKNNENAKVVLTFTIDDICIKITRSLYELKIDEVSIITSQNSYNLSGEIITQRKYDLKQINKRSEFLQYSYESFIAEKCNFSDFDDLLFFINDILTFDESREMLLWNKAVQIPLLSKYFNPPELDREIEELKREIKYYDSLSRHKSEDIRAINKVLDRRENTNKNHSTHTNDIFLKLSKVKNQYENINSQKISLTDTIKKENQLLRDSISRKSQLISEINSIEECLSELRNKIYDKIWINLNPKYDIFLKNISNNNSCPLCNNELKSNYLKERITNNHCILCEHELMSQNTEFNIETTKYENNIKSLLQEKMNIEKLIVSKQKLLTSLENKSNELYIKSLKLKESIHTYEQSLQIDSSDDNDASSLQIIYDELKELEMLKVNFQNKRDFLKSKLNEKISQMEEKVLLSTKDISHIFSEYSNKFLGIYSKLIYDYNPTEGEKMYIPFINTTSRYTSESLSESQSFFVDQSFRFSIIDFFNTNKNSNSFYMCETPDSSLDISYEINAAQIFIDFSNKPNTFILTSNLNNSKFIEYIIKNCRKINYINLLDIGNVSRIQKYNNDLNSISKRIEGIINEKHK